MYYSVDEINNNIVKLINRENESIIEINKNLLPNKIKEGTILKYTNKEYKIDNKETRIIKENIKKRFNKLKKSMELAV